MIYFSSDLHLGHANIIKYSKRPFHSVAEMDEELVSRWNSLVKPQDTSYILGDLSFYKTKEETEKLVSRMNGHKFLIRGNHDYLKSGEYRSMGFEGVFDYLEIKHNKRKYCLMHFPILSWNKMHRGSYMLHGHSHGGLNAFNLNTTRLDVGVDNFHYYPISIEEVEKILGERTVTPVDHHD